ncbi:MAG: hypothetical protein BWY76_02230 [bacterium ADurb.Bin429]|nr:MAG: hypothetical protein BWY76_02230 [bacterium ADurb.Bin429]
MRDEYIRCLAESQEGGEEFAYRRPANHHCVGDAVNANRIIGNGTARIYQFLKRASLAPILPAYRRQFDDPVAHWR